jgi:enoyl-[acyl-carrier protein] reductase/trans-2-enoyl-CoA reductase (NAD+)
VVITKKVLRNVSLTAHPLGCRRHVEDRIAWVKNPKGPNYSPVTTKMPARVLVIGGSTGYGLSSRIVAAFGGGADTINVSFEREPSERRTATPGWYNTKVFEEHARKNGLKAFSIFGDAFSDEVKEETAALIEERFGQVDLIVYSVASPVRTDPGTGATYRSVLKPIGKPFTALSVNMDDPTITKETIEPATKEQTEETIKVMGVRTGSCGSISSTRETSSPKERSPSPSPTSDRRLPIRSIGKGRSEKRRKTSKGPPKSFPAPSGRMFR